MEYSWRLEGSMASVQAQQRQQQVQTSNSKADPQLPFATFSGSKLRVDAGVLQEREPSGMTVCFVLRSRALGTGPGYGGHGGSVVLRCSNSVSCFFTVQQLIAAAAGGDAQATSRGLHAPDTIVKGGERIFLELELRLKNDVGIVGESAVGKTSLVSALTSYQSRIGPGGFQTRRPHLAALRWGRSNVGLCVGALGGGEGGTIATV
ncbi:GTP-binding protein [Cyclospora cayetanensis]|uniref:GTP-binding protein n=1 Tax=Cyclospora cayetanensis TaxID=88456 RepID=A0A1D3CUK1_9EIME|nr:GTP-binding protein [Cyclospora cayetanensis]